MIQSCTFSSTLAYHLTVNRNVDCLLLLALSVSARRVSHLWEKRNSLLSYSSILRDVWTSVSRVFFSLRSETAFIIGAVLFLCFFSFPVVFENVISTVVLSRILTSYPHIFYLQIWLGSSTFGARSWSHNRYINIQLVHALIYVSESTPKEKYIIPAHKASWHCSSHAVLGFFGWHVGLFNDMLDREKKKRAHLGSQVMIICSERGAETCLFPIVWRDGPQKTEGVQTRRTAMWFACIKTYMINIHDDHIP